MENNKILKIFKNGEVRLYTSNGKRGPIWSRTVVLKCTCGNERVISKRKLNQYKTDLCLNCTNSLKRDEFKLAMEENSISNRFINKICKSVNGQYINVLQ